MNKLCIPLILVALMTTVVNAQKLNPVSFGLQATGAAVNFEQPLKEIYGSGFGGGLHVDFNLPVVFSIRLSGDYISFSPDIEKFKAAIAGGNPGTQASQYSIDGGRLGFLQISVNGKASLGTPTLSPYLTAGAGTTTIMASDLTVKHPNLSFPDAGGVKSQTKFSVNLGPGVDLDLVAIKLYLEMKYTWIFTEGSTSTYIPVSLGITF